MSISTLGTLFQFIGGLGMFLYGMESMADGLQKFAGNRLQRVLEILTSNRLLGVLVGAGVTAIIQSSSATTVMPELSIFCRRPASSWVPILVRL